MEYDNIENTPGSPISCTGNRQIRSEAGRLIVRFSEKESGAVMKRRGREQPGVIS
jgi:hypothetical protein